MKDLKWGMSCSGIKFKMLGIKFLILVDGKKSFGKVFLNVFFVCKINDKLLKGVSVGDRV